MGWGVSNHQPKLAPQLGAHHAVLRLSAGDPKSDLHQRHRVGEYELAKITKNRGSFPSDDALIKLFYLALRNISQRWTMPIRDWKAALTRFTIQFEERMPNH